MAAAYEIASPASRSLRQAFAIVVLLLAWEILGRAGWIDPFYAPPPSTIGAALYQVFADGSIWPHLVATFSAAMVGPHPRPRSSAPCWDLPRRWCARSPTCSSRS